jgi:hypothetical protein
MTKTNKTVTIKTATVGQAFGTVAMIKARNGRVLWTSDTKPYGFTTAAIAAAECEAAKRGYIVTKH